MGHVARRTPFGTAVVLLLLVGAGGCLDNPTRPTSVLVVAEGEEGKSMEVWTSTVFSAGQDPSSGGVAVIWHVADTVVAESSFQEVFPIRPALRFAVRVLSAEEETHRIRLRVFLDSDRRYDETRDLDDDFLQFVYVFN